jgi:hypothetical protein
MLLLLAKWLQWQSICCLEAMCVYSDYEGRDGTVAAVACRCPSTRAIEMLVLQDEGRLAGARRLKCWCCTMKDEMPVQGD